MKNYSFKVEIDIEARSSEEALRTVAYLLQEGRCEANSTTKLSLGYVDAIDVRGVEVDHD